MSPLYLIPLCGSWLDCVWQAIKDWIGDQVKWLIGMIFQPILDAISSAVTVIMGTIGTFWVYVPTLPVGTETMGDNPGRPASGTVQWMWEHTQYIAFFVAVLGVLAACIKLAYTHRGESARDILRSLITLGVASALAVGVTQALIEFGDDFSKCIVTTSLIDDPNSPWKCSPGDLAAAAVDGKAKSFGGAMTAMLSVSATVGPMGIGLAIAVGILAIIAGVIQIVLMVVRSALLILLVGMLPIAAAATHTEMGRNWFKKLLGWMFAFVLYKPVAAIIYATAIRLTSNNGQGLRMATADETANSVLNMVTGLTLLVLALFALPGLMRFIVPMVAATAGQAGAGMIAAKMVGADKLAGKMQDSISEGSSGSEGGSGDGPTGSRNVGRARNQPQSSGGQGGSGAGQGASGASGGATGGQGAAAGAGGGGGGAAAGAAGGGGGAAAGGAAAGGAGAAAALGPAAAVAAPVAVIAAGVKATKQVGEMAAQETLGDDGPQGSGGGGESQGGNSSGGGGGGSGDGPSGSGGSPRDVNRDRQRQQRQFRDDDRRDSDGPRGSS
ncbi:hypothetical protein ACI2LF_03910 [Kribbella sp. NPDC020789]